MHPSRFVRLLLLVMMGLACLSLLALISWRDQRAFLWVLVCLSGFLCLLFFAYRLKLGQVRGRLMITAANELMYIVLDSRNELEATYRLMRIENRVVWNYLISFRAIDEEGRVWQFLILFDSVSEDAFRRLKVFLRWC